MLSGAHSTPFTEVLLGTVMPWAAQLMPTALKVLHVLFEPMSQLSRQEQKSEERQTVEERIASFNAKHGEATSSSGVMHTAALSRRYAEFAKDTVPKFFAKVAATPECSKLAAASHAPQAAVAAVATEAAPAPDRTPTVESSQGFFAFATRSKIEAATGSTADRADAQTNRPGSPPTQ